MSSAPMSDQPLQRTSLYGLHMECAGRMVPFAGYEMPVQFADGIIKENLHTRIAAGLFDASHMGQIVVRPKSGDMNDAAHALERLAPVDILGLREGHQRYALLTNEAGGILDDLMVARRHDHFLLVVNASRKQSDLAHLQAHLSADCEIIMRSDYALLSLQGPEAESVLLRLAPESAAMRFMEVRTIPLLGEPCDVSRSGYTGEDGFEICVAAHTAELLARRLLNDSSVAPAGLGARDSLRLEAGLCLYGNEIDETTTPVEAALEWAIQSTRREGGARAGGFPGAEKILRQFATGAPRRRVGLRPEGPALLRGGATLFAGEQSATPVGAITSGGFSPSLKAPIAMGWVETSAADGGKTLFADLRGRRIAVSVCALPFLPHRYKRR